MDTMSPMMQAMHAIMMWLRDLGLCPPMTMPM